MKRGGGARVVIGLGSNLDDPQAQLEGAIFSLNMLDACRLLATSPCYRTRPIGPEQPDFLNAVVLLETTLPPHDLLEALQGVEAQQGRVRREHWGPRTLDLDILLYDNAVLDTPDLKIPHPEMLLRAFVLIPMLELDHVQTLPMGEYWRATAQEIETDGVERLDGELGKAGTAR